MKSRRVDLTRIPEGHLQGIGSIALAWAFLEGSIERIVWRMLRINDRQGIAVTAHLTMPSRMNMALALVHDEFPESDEHKSLKAINKKIFEDKTIDGVFVPSLSSKRNRAVHSRLFKFNDSPVLRMEYQGRRRIERNAVEVSDTEYPEIVASILETTDEMLELLSSLIALVETKDTNEGP